MREKERSEREGEREIGRGGVGEKERKEGETAQQ